MCKIKLKNPNFKIIFMIYLNENNTLLHVKLKQVLVFNVLYNFVMPKNIKTFKNFLNTKILRLSIKYHFGNVHYFMSESMRSSEINLLK